VRALLLFLLPLLAAPVGAGEPEGGAGAAAVRSVTWLTPLGDWRADRIAAVVSEQDGVAVVRGADGRTLKIPFRQIDELAREGPDRADLLAARRAARHGRDLDRAAAVLDRYAADEKQPAWVREYAVAARATVAARRGDKDAEKRLRAFLEAYPDSRHRARAHLELARVVLAAGAGAFEDRMTEDLPRHFETIHGEGGSLLRQYELPVVLAEEFVEKAGVYELAKFRKRMAGWSPRTRKELGPDELLALERGGALVACLEMRLMVAERVEAGEPAPHVRLEARRQLRRCTFQQPQLKAEVWLILGDAERSCGNDEAARKAYAKAAELVADVPDPYWRERAERALARLG